VIDAQGYRHNIGIILSNKLGHVFWAKRLGQEAWQFPQGGMHDGEKPEDTLFRELTEEIGLEAKDVRILGKTRDWLRYKIPERMVRDSSPLCIGQKQFWFLLLLKSPDTSIQLSHHVAKPEFDDWMWVSYWYPLRQVVRFKREVYRRALKELASDMPPGLKPWRAKPLDPLWDREQGHSSPIRSGHLGQPNKPSSGQLNRSDQQNQANQLNQSSQTTQKLEQRREY